MDIFIECTSLLNVSPQNCVYVGGSLVVDFNGALNACMVPILIDSCLSSCICELINIFNLNEI